MRVLPQSPLDWVLLAVGTATAIIIAQITLLAVGAIAVYVIAARREERQLEDRFGEAFRDYQLGTGYVVPPVFRPSGAR